GGRAGERRRHLSAAGRPGHPAGACRPVRRCPGDGLPTRPVLDRVARAGPAAVKGGTMDAGKTPEAAQVVHDATGTARLTVLSFVAACLLALTFFLPLPDAWHVVAAYLLPLPNLALLLCALRLCRLGPAPLPRTAFVAGVVLMLGGICFDVIATGIHTPDLAQEGNPIARALLDSRHSVSFLYVYGLGMQGVLGGTMCALWAAYLRHHGTWLETVRRRRPRSPGQFLAAAAGVGANPGPVRSRLPAAYHLTWLVVPVVLGEGAYRWYLGLAWFDVLPQLSSYEMIEVGGMVLTMVGSWFWLAMAYDMTRPPAGRADLV